VHSAQNIWLALRSHFLSGRPVSSAHALMFEYISQLLLLSELTVGLSGIALYFLGGFTFFEIDMLLNRVSRRKYILNLLLIFFLLELHPITRSLYT
jgi:hypothetical protein